MTPVDFNHLASSEAGGSDFLLDGRPFSGIAYERDPASRVIVRVMGFDRGRLSGCARAWSRSGILLEEEFYRSGAFHGPVRTWRADGTLKSNDYRHHAKRPPPEGPADSIIDIDLDALEFVEHPWTWGQEPPAPLSLDEFRGQKWLEGEQYHQDGNDEYVIQQADGREVVHVESIQLQARSLFVAYERRSLRFSDAFASRLIQAKILGDVLGDTYRGRVDRIVFRSTPTKLVEVVPYSAP